MKCSRPIKTGKLLAAVEGNKKKLWRFHKKTVKSVTLQRYVKGFTAKGLKASGEFICSSLRPRVHSTTYCSRDKVFTPTNLTYSKDAGGKVKR